MTDETIPPDHIRTTVIPTWLAIELETIRKDQAKIAKLKEDQAGVPIWSEIHTRLGNHIKKHNLAQLDTGLVKSAQLSVQSSIGNSAERLFAAVAGQVIAEGSGNNALTDYVMASTFSTDVNKLRETAKANPSAVKDDVVVAFAKRFYVRPGFIDEFLTDPRKPRTYPDSVSRFADNRVHIAEHKLSGDNDSKAVEKNLSVIAGLRAEFAVDDQVVKTGVVLTFSATDKRYVNRWKNKGVVDVVAANKDIWPFLFGLAPASDGVYTLLVREMAELGAHRMFAFVAPDTLKLNTEDPAGWKWVTEEPDNKEATP